MKNIAVILAAGKGTRLGESTPKQYLEVAGKTVLEHSIEAFERHPAIEEICVVVAPDCCEKVAALCHANGYRKTRKIIAGGSERYESSVAAIRAYGADDECNLIFHDAARPCVSAEVISNVVGALAEFSAATAAVATTDTILEASDDGVVAAIPPRARLRNVQTPQGFRLNAIRRAYEAGLADPAFVTTDDCGVVARYCPDLPIRIVDGDRNNIKLTYSEDLRTIERLLSR